MKIALLKSFFIIFILSQMCSCAPPLYFPNAINAPMFSKKGQFTLNGSADNVGGNVQIGAAPANKFAFLINYNWGDYTENTSSTITGSGGYSYTHTYKSGHEHKFFEVGGGTYGTIGGHGRYEYFGLIGMGNANSWSENISRDAKYFRYAMQGDLGIETKAFEGVFSTRIGYLNLNCQSNYNETLDQSSMFVDPAVTLKVGWTSFKVFVQLGFDIPFNSNSSQWEKSWNAFGIQMKF